MGESANRLDNLRYLYFTGEYVSNGPKCHSCMNDAFRSNEFDAIEQVFVMTVEGLVPFLIRSLVCLNGGDTPFSLKYISERLLLKKCVQCSIREDPSNDGGANLCGNGRETSQEIGETEKDREQDIVAEVVESLLLAVSNYPCEGENGLPKNPSEASRGGAEFFNIRFNENFMQTEQDGTSSAVPYFTQSAAGDNSNQVAVPTPSEKKKRICIGNAVAEAKRIKTEVEDDLNPGMIIRWGNIEHDQVQVNAIRDEDGEEATRFSFPFAANTVLNRDVIQPSSFMHRTFPSVKGHNGSEEPSYVIPLHNTKCESVSATSSVERMLEPPYEWFPFVRGRCQSTVADPITSVDMKPLMRWVNKDRDNIFEFLLRKHFNNKEKIRCSACHKTVSLRGKGFQHFLGANHFKLIKSQNRVFSRSEDWLKLNEMLKRTQKLLAEENKKRKLLKEAKEREDSRINGINFPFLRGRTEDDVQTPIFFTYPLQKPLDAISSEVKSNLKFRTIARQTYFIEEAFHYCEYCEEKVVMYDLFVHSLSAVHLQRVLCTGEVFCKERDYNQIFLVFENLKRKLHGQLLPSESRLPFGYGKSRQDNPQFVSFEDIFNFLTALQRTGQLDSDFNDFLIEHYPDTTKVDLCPYCGPLLAEKYTVIHHFLSINHIFKAMEIGQVFVKDLTVLKNLFHSYLQKSNCKHADLLLNSVEFAIKKMVYTRESREFEQLSEQILNANTLQQALRFPKPVA